MLTRLLLLLLPVFAALTASVASSHAQAVGYHPEARLSAADSSYRLADDPFALPACSDTCLPVAESSGDGSDDGALLRISSAVPAVDLSSGLLSIDPFFSFLRYRTSEPRAPPAQA
ncbi:hypothetical protein HNQ96_000181 [Aminobacter lissarensis]|uniref:Uncharacterized protein n=1 Tax=Aminobacter carboxidus TaxID=376165 RepID=A0A8E2BAS1_9HYPH|nr:hypothetical protein [Aminobacter lissarensis]MBB6464334.1 hypothetical protein [Aminobacter lissarensis]